MNDDRIERYLSGEMSDPERVEFEQEILQSRALAESVYADVQLQSTLRSAADARRLQGTVEAPRARRTWWRFPALRWAVPAAVAVAFIAVFAIVQRTGEGPGRPEVFRGGGAAFSAISPVGEVSERPTRFAWTSHPDAVRYRFELFDATSTRVHTTVTADTAVSAGGVTPETGHWTVTPLGPNLSSIGDEVFARFHVHSD